MVEMTRLLILADDLTGALDAGVQFTNKGDKVVIVSDYTQAYTDNSEADVLVVDTESRHIDPAEAYRRIHTLVSEARQRGIARVYKKTDSGLRGNVGAELSALLDASGEKTLHFVPAWPKMNRVTRNGIHYVNGKPLAESIFAQDVINPVTESSVTALIMQQSSIPAYTGEADEGIIVHDCETDEDMRRLAAELVLSGSEHIFAGCSGFLETFPRQSGADISAANARLSSRLLVLSGSLNAITCRQLEVAEENGALRRHVPMDSIAENNWPETDISTFAENFLREADTEIAVVDTLSPMKRTNLTPDELAQRIAASMGKLAKQFLLRDSGRTIMIIGGDTLLGFIRELGIGRLQPITEVSPGIVLAEYSWQGEPHYLITKSGGFGKESELNDIEAYLKERTGAHI